MKFPHQILLCTVVFTACKPAPTRPLLYAIDADSTNGEVRADSEDREVGADREVGQDQGGYQAGKISEGTPPVDNAQKIPTEQNPPRVPPATIPEKDPVMERVNEMVAEDPVDTSSKALTELKAFLDKKPGKFEETQSQSFAQVALTLEDAKKAKELLWNRWRGRDWLEPKGLLGDGTKSAAVDRAGAVLFQSFDEEVLRLIRRHAGNAIQAEFHHPDTRGNLFIEFGRHVLP